MWSLENPAQAISLLCGWTYVVLWSLSFYTQPFFNFQRRSTQGLAFDWPFLNVYGAVSYTASSGMLLYSSTVRQEYAFRHPQACEPTIRFNDLCFGLHSLVLCTITASQFWPSIWQWKGAQADRTLSGATRVVFWGGLLAVGAVSCLVRANMGDNPADDSWGWLDVAYVLGDIKLAVTVVKFIPQITSNHKRKSTAGLAMLGVWMDFVGGIFSLVQLGIDSAVQGDWSGVAANPSKLGLANLSMLADVVFMMQHYLLYRSHRGEQQDCETCNETVVQGERSPLLAKDGMLR